MSTLTVISNSERDAYEVSRCLDTDGVSARSEGTAVTVDYDPHQIDRETVIDRVDVVGGRVPASSVAGRLKNLLVL
jgi:hypothetical protein